MLQETVTQMNQCLRYRPTFLHLELSGSSKSIDSSDFLPGAGAGLMIWLLLLVSVGWSAASAPDAAAASWKGLCVLSNSTSAVSSVTSSDISISMRCLSVYLPVPSADSSCSSLLCRACPPLNDPRSNPLSAAEHQQGGEKRGMPGRYAVWYV
jgi:hypothetical protein